MSDGGRYPRATKVELAAFESEYGAVLDDHRWFLSECGGGTVGSEWVGGIAELPDSLRKFSSEFTLVNG